VAKNKDSFTKNRTGEFDLSQMTITHIDPKTEVRTVYSIIDILKPLDGELISLTVAADTEALSVEEE
jgi:hypothetical protein